MDADRRVRLWREIVERADGERISLEHVCAVAVSAAGVDAAAVAVVLSATPRETLYASDRRASEWEELSLTLGEGPGVDACAVGPSLVADLSAMQCRVRWPAYAPAVVDAGARAVFALPLQVGAIRLGVMDLYRVTPGALDDGQLADALILADTACALLLDRSGPEGLDGDAHRPGGNGHWSDGDGHWPDSTGPQHPQVHQATGMVIVQLGVSAAVALMRLRAYAYAHDRRLSDVAADVVARRLRFEPDSGPGGAGVR